MTSKKTTMTKAKAPPTKGAKIKKPAPEGTTTKVVTRKRRVTSSLDWKTAKDQLFWRLVWIFDASTELHRDLELFKKAKKTEFLDFREGKISKKKIFRELTCKRPQETPKSLRKRAAQWKKIVDRLEERAAKLEAAKP